MLEDLLTAIGRIEALQTQSWGMVINKKHLAKTQEKPLLDRVSNLLSVTTEQGGTVIKFDPALKDADRWALIEVDGGEPNAKTLKAHRQRYTGRGQKMPIEQLPPVGDMVPKSSVVLCDMEDGYQVATFTPHIKLPVIGDIAKRLTGRIWYDVERQYIERIVVQNEDKLSPVPGLSISQLHLGMTFALVDGGRQEGDKHPIVLVESELLVMGKKLFKAFNQISHYAYSGHWLA